MWDIYDKIISEVADDIYVNHIVVGKTWTVVLADNHCGIAVTVNEQNYPLGDFSHLHGCSLKDLAQLSKSWNFIEASIGTAAINAYLSSPKNKANLTLLPTQNAFTDYKEKAAGKKVAIIGHFINLERFLTNSQVHVLERNPLPGDYPDSACEYLLPDMDYTFITGSAFINKTLPRLIELSKNPIILGPSTPLSTHLLDFGAKELSGLIPNILTKKDAITISKGDEKLSNYGTRVRAVQFE